MNDAGALPIWEPSAPFRNLLHWSLADTGLAFTHAAVVGTSAGGVLLAGRGGAGKSTTAMACVDAGWRYVADDYCVLDVSAIPPLMLSTARQRSRRGRWTGFPASPKWSGRSAMTARSFSRWGGRSRGSSPRRFPCVPSSFPRWAGPPARSSRCHPPPARALAPSTLFQLPGSRQSSLGTIAAILRRVPVFGLDVGPDLEAIPGALLPAIEGPRT